jgi:predicted nucleic acid-binding protein
MKWKLPFVTRATHESVLADRERVRGERNQFEKDRDTQKAVARAATEKYADLFDKYNDTAIVNECLTRDLEKAKARLAEFGVRRTVSDVLEEHDVHRKALADALGPQKYHLTWDQLIAEVGRLHGATAAWMADYEAEKQCADLAHADLTPAERKAVTEWHTRLKERADWVPLGTPREDEARMAGGTARPVHPAVILHQALTRCLALEGLLAKAEGRAGVVAS